MTDKTITSHDLRPVLLRGGKAALEKLVEMATSTDSTNAVAIDRAQAKLIDAVLPILQKMSDVQQMELTNARAVIEAVAQGQLTIPDAERLVKLLNEADADNNPAVQSAAFFVETITDSETGLTVTTLDSGKLLASVAAGDIELDVAERLMKLASTSAKHQLSNLDVTTLRKLDHALLGEK